MNNSSTMTKLLDANLEHLYIETGGDLLKQFKKIKPHILKELKYKFDFLNGRKMDEDDENLKNRTLSTY